MGASSNGIYMFPDQYHYYVTLHMHEKHNIGIGNFQVMLLNVSMSRPNIKNIISPEKSNVFNCKKKLTHLELNSPAAWFDFSVDGKTIFRLRAPAAIS
jgi:hypothetical protein